MELWNYGYDTERVSRENPVGTHIQQVPPRAIASGNGEPYCALGQWREPNPSKKELWPVPPSRDVFFSSARLPRLVRKTAPFASEDINKGKEEEKSHVAICHAVSLD